MAKQLPVGLGLRADIVHTRPGEILKQAAGPEWCVGGSIRRFGVSWTWKFRGFSGLRYCVSITCIAADRRSPEEEEPAVAFSPSVSRPDPFDRIVTCWDPPCLA